MMIIKDLESDEAWKIELCQTKWVWGKECLNILRSPDAQCVFILGIVSSMSIIGVMGCIWKIFGESSFIAWNNI
jgi:hypothetical protein